MDYQIGAVELLGLLLGILFLVIAIIQNKNLLFKNFIVAAVFVRVCLLLCDMLHLFPIPNLGADSEFFHYLAESNQENSDPRYVTNYTVFLTYFYSFTNCSRVMAQFINVLFGVGVIIYGQKCLRLFNIEKRLVKIGTLILCFEPNLIIFSGGLLREAWVEFFTTISLFYFFKWYKFGSVNDFIQSIVLLLGGTYMHGGTIGIVFGYFLVLTLYKREEDTFKLNARSWLAIVAVWGFSMFLSNYMDVFGNKLDGVDTGNVDEVLISGYKKQYDKGGSDYLLWLPVSSMSDAIVFSPFKMFYFLLSPVPWEWRGIQDILAFFIDSIWYLILCWGIYKSKPNAFNTLKRGLIMSLLTVVFIFGIGVTNSGTAMRHRAKLLSFIVVTYCISKSIRQNKECIDYKLTK